ncbi:uncharacterized protein LMH87_008575 [Akanthomyces muscarius]|uniref:Uncharacterized protein n=1 Tax=Akanthomyces muscarius TaxID=2231603 RepID=A0A9W8QIB6_AKAMU|nr:uncharacterized protein LMH87_008575 [Akanthomyces muscarius]KAJ4158028.1 hypothetical protein LMH87_008575 [Akanthomyces muscarius]
MKWRTEPWRTTFVNIVRLSQAMERATACMSAKRTGAFWDPIPLNKLGEFLATPWKLTSFTCEVGRQEGTYPHGLACPASSTILTCQARLGAGISQGNCVKSCDHALFDDAAAKAGTTQREAGG